MSETAIERDKIYDVLFGQFRYEYKGQATWNCRMFKSMEDAFSYGYSETVKADSRNLAIWGYKMSESNLNEVFSEAINCDEICRKQADALRNYYKTATSHDSVRVPSDVYELLLYRAMSVMSKHGKQPHEWYTKEIMSKGEALAKAETESNSK